MIIPPRNLPAAEILKVFEDGQRLFQDLQNYQASQQNSIFEIQQLSMGMSGDYVQAIEKGSTMVRLGSLLFGDRLPVSPP